MSMNEDAINAHYAKLIAKIQRRKWLTVGVVWIVAVGLLGALAMLLP